MWYVTHFGQHVTKLFEIFQGNHLVTVDFQYVVCGLLKSSDHQETNFNVLQTRRPFFAGRTNFNSERKISFYMCNSTFDHFDGPGAPRIVMTPYSIIVRTVCNLILNTNQGQVNRSSHKITRHGQATEFWGQKLIRLLTDAVSGLGSASLQSVTIGLLGLPLATGGWDLS